MLCSTWGLSFPTRDGTVSPALQGRFATTGAPGKYPKSVFPGSQDQLPWSHHPPPPHHHHPCSVLPTCQTFESEPPCLTWDRPRGLEMWLKFRKTVVVFFFFFSVSPLLSSFCRLKGRSEPHCEAALLGQKARPQPRPGAFSTRHMDSAGSARAPGRA